MDGQRYAVPIGQVEEILSPTDLTIETSSSRPPVFALREDIVPLHDLRGPLGLASTPHAAQKNQPLPGTILVVRHLGRRMGLSVDGISGQQHVVVRKLSGALENLAGFVGGTILGDGEPGFIIDVPFWATHCFNQRKGVA